MKDDPIFTALNRDASRREFDREWTRSTTDLERRLAVERAEARGNVSMGAQTSGEQLAYVERLLANEASSLPEAVVSAPNEWIPHDGGPSPVPCGTAIEVMLRNGATYSRTPFGGDFTDPDYYRWWRKANNGTDIIGYRLIKPATPVDTYQVFATTEES